MKLLEVRGLKVGVDGREILHGVDIGVGAGETVVLLGVNGAGKSTLAGAVMGVIGGREVVVQREVGGEEEREGAGSAREVEVRGEVVFEGKNIEGMEMDARARAGIFMSWQAPVEVPGVTMTELLWTAIEERAGKGVSRREVEEKIARGISELKLEAFSAGREVNVGASGGERKAFEVLQMMVLGPKLAILDEIDSGLDVDAARRVSGVVAKWQRETGAGLLIISHNMRILEKLVVDRVYILDDGRIVKVGGRELMAMVMKEGFKGGARRKT